MKDLTVSKISTQVMGRSTRDNTPSDVSWAVQIGIKHKTTKQSSVFMHIYDSLAYGNITPHNKNEQ